MRDELHLMELVDRYVDGSMTATDRAAFEMRANANADLRQLIEDQRALREGIARVPVRAAAAKAYRSYRFGKPGPWIGGAVVVAVITSAALFWANSSKEQVKHEAPVTEAATTTDDIEHAALDDTTGTRLRPMVLSINPAKDTTLLTPSGLVIDIPRGAFLDAQGRALTEAVRVTVLEALDAVSIIKAGLSTMNGDTLLETGGMFYFDARHDGERAAIDSAKPITVMVPSANADPRMMLYQGVRAAEGLIDWREPQPLKRSLVPVDITTLNFYPPGYEKKLSELGQDVARKAFRDSLYWSFANQIRSASQWETMDFSANTDSVQSFVTYSSRNGIDPAKVKTIWSPRFNGTNLATREFEERMRAIHGTCDNAVLDLYAQGLDNDLSELDARAARMGHSAFDALAKRNDGRVNLPKHAAERLRTMYENWSRAEADAIRKTQERFWAEQAKLDGVADRKRVQHSAQTEARRQELFQREYDANLAD
ncbi:MAG TPA: hypothetical protein PKY96_11525, partial [Flavobacteriales bacterium]|nr:hypothetical protein [Flavobacteriales bacterium]